MKILVLKGKHWDSYFKYDTSEQKNKAHKIVFEMNRCYYTHLKSDRESLLLKKIDETLDPMKIRKFIWDRSHDGHEYEELIIEDLL